MTLSPLTFHYQHRAEIEAAGGLAHRGGGTALPEMPKCCNLMVLIPVRPGNGEAEMNTPDWVKPAAWGVVGGAIAAIIVGFFWGGWVTGGTATMMEAASAEAAVVQAFTPLCVAKAEQQPEQLVLLKAEKSWKRDDFVVEAGWVANVNEKYRADVGRACALAVIEAMETKETAAPAN